MKIQDYKVEDATHYLECSHQYNRYSRVEYKMLCIIVKEMPNNRYKIVVFGDHRKKLKYTNGKRRIRYVFRDRVHIRGKI